MAGLSTYNANGTPTIYHQSIVDLDKAYGYRLGLCYFMLKHTGIPYRNVISFKCPS